MTGRRYAAPHFKPLLRKQTAREKRVARFFVSSLQNLPLLLFAEREICTFRPDSYAAARRF